jgi:hypothetical protein
MSTSNASDTRTDVYVDRGHVSAAIAVLFAQSTLGDHVRIEGGPGVGTVRVYHDPDGVPYAMWGSGTQALWRLLSSIAYSSETVSLYEVVSRLDVRNRRAVAAAIAELCA